VDEDINLIIITPHGRSGSVFLQSLFDGHPEVLTLPTINFNYSLKLSLDKVENTIDEFINSHPEIFDTSQGYFGNKNNIDSPKLFGGNGNKHLQIDKNNFRRILLEDEFRDFVLTGEKITKKAFYIGVHKAYAKINSWNLIDLKYIIIHEHGYIGGHQEAISDFPELFYFATVRDPRESWLSWKIRCENYAGDFWSLLKKYFLYTFLAEFLIAIRNLMKIQEKINRDHLIIIDLNRLHEINELGMKDLCRILKIDYNRTLLKSTFMGYEWKGNASDGSSSSGFDVSKARLKWPTWLTKEDSIYISSNATAEIEFLNYSKSEIFTQTKFHYPIFSSLVFLYFQITKINKSKSITYPIIPGYAIKYFRVLRYLWQHLFRFISLVAIKKLILKEGTSFNVIFL